jgi:hypothetical protein
MQVVSGERSRVDMGRRMMSLSYEDRSVRFGILDLLCYGAEVQDEDPVKILADLKDSLELSPVTEPPRKFAVTVSFNALDQKDAEKLVEGLADANELDVEADPYRVYNGD